MGSFADTFVQQVFTKLMLCVSHFSGHTAESKAKPLPLWVYILVGKTEKQMNTE